MNISYSFGIMDLFHYGHLKALKKAVERKFECVYMTVDEINAKKIALPFPLSELESEKYIGEKITGLGLFYRPLEEGLKTSWLSFTK